MNIMAGMSRFSPMPPDLTLAHARLEADYFQLPLVGGLGELVMKTSESSDIRKALATHPAPAPIALDPEGTTIRVFELLAQDYDRSAIGTELGVNERTVRRHLKSLYGQAGTIDEGDTMRRLIEQGAIDPFGTLNKIRKPFELEPIEHLLAILVSRGWSIQHLTARSNQLDLTGHKTRLNHKIGAVSQAAITLRLFGVNHLATDRQIRTESTPPASTTGKPAPISLKNARPTPFARRDPDARITPPGDVTLALTRLEAERLGIALYPETDLGNFVMSRCKSPAAMQALEHYNTFPAPLARAITERELDIMDLFTHDLSTTEIAAKLSISPEKLSVETTALRKLLDAHSMAEAVRRLVERDLLILPAMPKGTDMLEADDFLMGSLISRGWTINAITRAITGIRSTKDIRKRRQSMPYRDQYHSLLEWGRLGVKEQPAATAVLFRQGWLLRDRDLVVK
jgi:DNA-binding CsgD family transcriptional regulator